MYIPSLKLIILIKLKLLKPRKLLKNGDVQAYTNSKYDKYVSVNFKSTVDMNLSKQMSDTQTNFNSINTGFFKPLQKKDWKYLSDVVVSEECAQAVNDVLFRGFLEIEKRMAYTTSNYFTIEMLESFSKENDLLISYFN